MTQKCKNVKTRKNYQQIKMFVKITTKEEHFEIENLQKILLLLIKKV